MNVESRVDKSLSIYAKAEKTIVDGVVYFDREKKMPKRVKKLLPKNLYLFKNVGG
jgi:hypothetical protein